MTTDTKPLAEQLRDHLAAEAEAEVATTKAFAKQVEFALNQTADILEPKREPFECDVDKQFFSLGKICEHFQLAPVAVRELMSRSGVRFTYCCNDIPFLDGAALLKMHHYLRDLRAAKESELRGKQND